MGVGVGVGGGGGLAAGRGHQRGAHSVRSAVGAELDQTFTLPKVYTDRYDSLVVVAPVQHKASHGHLGPTGVWFRCYIYAQKR